MEKNCSQTRPVHVSWTYSGQASGPARAGGTSRPSYPRCLVLGKTGVGGNLASKSAAEAGRHDCKDLILRVDALCLFGSL